MALFDRLVGVEGSERIAVHTFMASLAEYGRGTLIQAQIVKHWNLDAGEEGDLRTFFLDKQDAKTKAGDDTREYASIVHDVLILAEAKFEGYVTPDDVAGMLKALL